MNSGGDWRWDRIVTGAAVMALLFVAITTATHYVMATFDVRFATPQVQARMIGTNELVAISAAIIALLAFIATAWASLSARADSLRVEKSNAYFSLEVASSEVFKYEAEKELDIRDYRTVYPPRDRRKCTRLKNAPAAKTAYNLYFQTLNLFEVCARFRRQEIIEHEVFASWVAWFYDTLDDWYFRAMWEDFRCNYTNDVRDIFDLGIRLFEGHDAPLADKSAEETRDFERKDAFYKAVAAQMQCTEIETWLGRTKAVATAPAPLPGYLHGKLISLGLRTRPEPRRE